MREITDEVKKVIIGKDEVVDMVFAAILAQGHVLMEDVPGVGKIIVIWGNRLQSHCGDVDIAFTF